VRSNGYAIEVNEVVEGLMGIAAPVLDFTGDAVGVICLGFPATREKDQTFLGSAITKLKQTAAEVSANMGYVGDASAKAGSDEIAEQSADGRAAEE
jgi:DNA-binding IclR family transcriptional regulator